MFICSFGLPSQGLSESKYGLTSSSIRSISSELKKLRKITPPVILRAFTTSSTVARERSNSFTSGNGDLDDLTGLWPKSFWLVSGFSMGFVDDMLSIDSDLRFDSTCNKDFKSMNFIEIYISRETGPFYVRDNLAISIYCVIGPFLFHVSVSYLV